MTLAPLIILSGPSGVGKSTLIERVLKRSNLPLRLSVSVTTRARRKKEREDIDYYYWPRERFESEMDQGEFLEHARYVDNYYGTLRREVEPHRLQGTGVILDIDVQGARQVKEKCPEAVSIFLRASSPEAYTQRLHERGTDDEATIQRRLAQAQEELRHADEYDHQVVNDDLETALANLLEIIQSVFTRDEHAR